MSACLACLRPVPRTAGDAWHEACLERLFGRPALPEIDLDVSRLHEFAVAMLRGHRSLSGVQQKVSLGLERRSFTLRVGLGGRAFVLKPQTTTFPQLPENELLSMRLAEVAGVRIPPCALVRLADGSLAYLSQRFDRTTEGRKVRQEDFCQLAEQPPRRKYSGSAELCFRVVRRFATTPGLDAVELFRQLAVSWWLGNGDLHLKNLSMIMDDAGVRLSPAYDVVSTRLVIPDDVLALPIGSKRDKLTPRRWVDLAAYGEIPPKAAARVLAGIVGARPKAQRLVHAAPLAVVSKETLGRLLDQRTKVLGEAMARLMAR